METRDIVGFALVPLVILTAVLFAEVRFLHGFWLVPSILWFLRLVAYSLLLVGGTALLCQAKPSGIPIQIVWMVWGGTIGLMMLKFFWDVFLLLDQKGDLNQLGPFGPNRAKTSDGAWQQTPDLIGFSLVLFGAFLISRMAAEKRDDKQE